MTDTLQFIIDKNLLKIKNVVGHQIIEIPNVSRFDLIKWIRELDFKTGVEVGVAHAEYSKFLAYLNPQMEVWGVDPYVRYKGYHDYARLETFKAMYRESHDRMKPYGNYKFIEKFSVDALKEFVNESLDFVYIDANHSEPYISQDINGWSKKVKKGGIVAGHDYIKLQDHKTDVKEAVHKYIRENNLTLFILGRNEVRSGEMRERVRSWMFVKE